MTKELNQIGAEQAEIILKLYELRRENVMRASRDLLMKEFWPSSFDDVQAVMSNMDHPLNAAYRQVATYWEMVYSLARYGAVNADFLAESNGEGLFFFAKIEPYVEQIRASGWPMAFRNTEWLIENSKVASERSQFLRDRVAAMQKR